VSPTPDAALGRILAVSTVSTAEVILILAGLAMCAAVPWILARRGRGDSSPSASRPPFLVAFGRSMAVFFLLFGIGHVIDGKESLGVEEAVLGLLLGIVVAFWARRHPGYRWWRWQ
jgi:hypothetical protein